MATDPRLRSPLITVNTVGRGLERGAVQQGGVQLDERGAGIGGLVKSGAGQANGVGCFVVGILVERRRLDLELAIEELQQDGEISRREGEPQAPQHRAAIHLEILQDRHRRAVRYPAARAGSPPGIAGTKSPVGVACGEGGSVGHEKTCEKEE